MNEHIFQKDHAHNITEEALAWKTKLSELEDSTEIRLRDIQSENENKTTQLIEQHNEEIETAKAGKSVSRRLIE